MAKGKKNAKGKKGGDDDALFASDDDKKFELGAMVNGDDNTAASDGDDDVTVSAIAQKKNSKQKSKKKAPVAASGFDALAMDDVAEAAGDSDNGDEKPQTKTSSKSTKKSLKHARSKQSVDDDVEEEEDASATLERQMSDVQIASPVPPADEDNGGDIDFGDAKKKKKKNGSSSGKKKKSMLDETTAFGDVSPAVASKRAAAGGPAFRDADEGGDTDEDGEKKPAGHFSKQSEHLTATGILLSHERSKDVQIDKFSVAAYGQQLVNDTSLSILYGHRYGLVGQNGCGKSTLLRALANREVPVQQSVDLYLLEREYDATDLTAVEGMCDYKSALCLCVCFKYQSLTSLLSSIAHTFSRRGYCEDGTGTSRGRDGRTVVHGRGSRVVALRAYSG